MNRTYEEWLKYYDNATKEQVIEDMMLDIKEIQRLNNRIDKTIEYIENNDDLYYGDDLYDSYQTIINILNGKPHIDR